MNVGPTQPAPHPLVRPTAPRAEHAPSLRPGAPGPSPFNAAAGEVPFADFLRATNATERSAEHRPLPDARDRFEPSTPRPESSDACACPSSPADSARTGAPKLGDVNPVEPTPAAPAPGVRPIERVMSPLGAMIDLTV